MNNEERPTVVIQYCPAGESSQCLREICAGLEEEGIPYVLEIATEGDAVQLGYQAAALSRLGVGIGIDTSLAMCIHYHKLPRNRPLFHMRRNSQSGVSRWIGFNAARLVKGTPFKRMDG